MFASWKIARIAGIDLFIHWSFWLLPLWVIFSGDRVAGLPMGMHLLLIAALFACVVLHEFGHALTARHFGIDTRRITLSPLGGIAQLERMSHEPWEEFSIAIAGPLVNVAIALSLGFGLLTAFIVDANLMQTMGWQFLSVLLGLNVMLVVFNLLPAFPMDGGRVLRAVLASMLGLLQGTRVAVLIGGFTAALMGLAGVFLLGSPWLFLIALFVIWAGQQELRALEFEARERRTAARMTVRMWDPRDGRWVPCKALDAGA